MPESLTDRIIEEGRKQNINPKDDDELHRTLVYLRLQLKALVARDLWNMNEYFRIWNKQSRIVDKALELIEHPA